MPSTELHPYQQGIAGTLMRHVGSYNMLANPKSYLHTTQMLGRGLRGVSLFPTAMRSHAQLAMDDGSGWLVVLDLPQFEAAKYFASTDQCI